MAGAAAVEPSDEQARAALLDFVRLVQARLPASDLPAREVLDIRRDLVFLVAEARRRTFRPRVVELMCEAVLRELASLSAEPP